MIQTIRAACVIACFASALCAAPAVLHAQDDPETVKRVLAILQEANALYDAGSFLEAKQRYEQAYKLYPNPAIVYRLGQSSQQLGLKREAVAYYETFVRTKPDAPNVPGVHAEIAKLKATLPPRVVLVSEPEGADVYLGEISGDPVGTAPQTVELEPGKQTLYFRLDGYETLTQEVDLKPGEDVDVRAKLVKVGTTVQKLPAQQAPEEPANITGLGGIVTGIGGAMLVGGGVFSLLQSSATDEVNDFDKRDPSRSPAQARARLQELKDDAEGYHSTSLIFYGAGGLITAAGLGMIVYGMTQSQPEEVSVGALRHLDVSVDVSPSHTWFGLSGQF